MSRRWLPALLALILICAVATVASLVAGEARHPVAESVCSLAELVAAIAAAGLAFTTARTHEFGARNGWIRVGTAVLATNVSLVAGATGVVAWRVAVVSASVGAVLMLSALFAFEGARARPRAWLAVGLEIVSTGAVLLAAGWVAIELVAPDLLVASRLDQLVAATGGVLFVLVGCLAAAFALSSAGRSMVVFVLLGGWMATAAFSVTWVAVASVLEFEPGTATRLISAAGLCLPAAAAEISRSRPAPAVDVGGRLARAHRGLLAALTVIAIVSLLGVWSFDVLSETAAWIAVLGLPAVLARILVTARENHVAARGLRRQLDLSRERNAELQDARTSAEQACDAQRAFVRRTSHELRTPLHAVMGFAELLESEDLSGDGHAQLGQIRAAGRHLLDLADDLLDLQQVETGHFVVRREATGLRSLVVEAANQVGSLARDVDGRIAVVRGEWEETVVHTDARRVRQILTNLLSNALRHAGGTVTVSVESTPWLVKIDVADAGPGFGPDALARVFESYGCAAGRSVRGAGTGLGLPIAYSLADALGGRLSVESVVGVGTKFTLALPTIAWPVGGSDDEVDELLAAAALA